MKDHGINNEKTPRNIKFRGVLEGKPLCFLLKKCLSRESGVTPMGVREVHTHGESVDKPNG